MVEKDEKKKKINFREFLQKLPQTLTYLICFFSLGIFYAVTGPTMSLLAERMGVSENYAGYLLTFRGIGILPSSMLTGIIFGWFQIFDGEKKKPFLIDFFRITINKIMIFSYLIVTLTVVLTPFITNFVLMSILFIIQGVFTSFVEIGSYLCIANLWREKVYPFNQLLSTTFGLGNFLLPLLIAQIFSFVKIEKTQLYLSYFIAGCLTCMPCVWLLAFVNTPPAPRETSKKKKKEKEQPNKKERFNKFKKDAFTKFKSFFSVRNLIIFLSGCTRVCGSGAAIGFAGLIFLFGSENKLETNANLSYLVSLMYLLQVTIGPIFTLISVVIKPLYIAAISLGIVLVNFICWTIFVRSTIMLWIGTIVFGVFSAPLSSALLSLPLVNFGIPLNANTASFLSVLQFIGEIGMPTIMTAVSNKALLGSNGYIYSAMVVFLLANVFLAIVSVIGFFYNLHRKKKGKEGSIIPEISSESKEDQKDDKPIAEEKEMNSLYSRSEATEVTLPPENSAEDEIREEIEENNENLLIEKEPEAVNA